MNLFENPIRPMKQEIEQFVLTVNRGITACLDFDSNVSWEHIKMQQRLKNVISVQKIEVVMEKLLQITWTVPRYGFPMKFFFLGQSDLKILSFFNHCKDICCPL